MYDQMHTFMKIEREDDEFILPVNSTSAEDQTKSCDNLLLQRQQQNYIIIIIIEVPVNSGFRLCFEHRFHFKF